MSLVMSISDKVVALNFGTQDRRRHAGRGARAPGGDRRPISGDSDALMSTPLLDVVDLHAGYGLTRVLHGISFGWRRARITTLLGANGAGKTTTLRALCAHGPAAGRGALRRRAHRRPGDRGHRPPRHRPRARRAAAPSSHLIDRGEPAPRRLRAQGPGGGGAGLRAHLRLLPAPGRAAPPAGRHALGRRAADARGVARADAAAAPAAARRAFVRPGAADRARAVRDPAHDQPAASASASCWSSRTRRWRSTSPTTPTCSRPAGSCSRAAPSDVKNNDAVRASYLGY